MKKTFLVRFSAVLEAEVDETAEGADQLLSMRS